MKLKPRPQYLSKLVAAQDNSLIKVITGMRRCGKSSLLTLFRQHLLQQGIAEDHIIMMNLESFQYSSFTFEDLHNAIADRMQQDDHYYLLLDEVQLVDKWERAVNALPHGCRRGHHHHWIERLPAFQPAGNAAFRQIHGDQCISAFFRGIHGVRRSDRRERGFRKVHKIWRIAAGRESRHRSKPGIHRAFRNLRHYFGARYFAISASKKSTSFQRCRTIFGRYRRISSLNFEDRKSIEKRASTSFK